MTSIASIVMETLMVSGSETLMASLSALVDCHIRYLCSPLHRSSPSFVSSTALQIADCVNIFDCHGLSSVFLRL